MLFSGVAQAYECPECEVNYSYTMPTSIIPMLVCAYAATVLWSGFLGVVLGEHWSVYVLSPVLGIGFIPVVYVLVRRLVVPWASSRTCPTCKSALKVVGGGFISGAPPSRHEISTYLLVVGVPSLLWGAALHVA